VDVEIFESGKKKVADTKISGYVWTGPVALSTSIRIFLRTEIFSLLSLPATRKRSFDQFSGTKNGPRVEILKTLNSGYRGDGGKLKCYSYLHRFFVFEWKGRNDLNI